MLFLAGRSHAEEKVLARDWKLEIDTSLTETPTWTEVGGLNSFKFGGKKKDADTTTFDDNGQETHLVASRSKTLSVEAKYLEDPVSKLRDPGQDAVESLADEIGTTSLGDFRLTSPAGAVRTFKASADVGEIGGKNDDPTSFNFELTISGAVTKS